MINGKKLLKKVVYNVPKTLETLDRLETKTFNYLVKRFGTGEDDIFVSDAFVTKKGVQKVSFALYG